mgnify:CR=1 FL=1
MRRSQGCAGVREVDVRLVFADELGDADTADLEGEYFYELFIVNTLGESTSIMKGLIQVSPARAD